MYILVKTQNYEQSGAGGIGTYVTIKNYKTKKKMSIDIKKIIKDAIIKRYKINYPNINERQVYKKIIRLGCLYSNYDSTSDVNLKIIKIKNGNIDISFNSDFEDFFKNEDREMYKIERKTMILYEQINKIMKENQVQNSKYKEIYKKLFELMNKNCETDEIINAELCNIKIKKKKFKTKTKSGYKIIYTTNEFYVKKEFKAPIPVGETRDKKYNNIKYSFNKIVKILKPADKNKYSQ